MNIRLLNNIIYYYIYLNNIKAGKLFVCYVATSPSIDKILQSQLPAKEGRGVIMPSVNSKVCVK